MERGAWSVERGAWSASLLLVAFHVPRIQSRNALAPLGRERTRRLAVPPNLIECADPLKHQQPAEHSIVLRRLAALVTVG